MPGPEDLDPAQRKALEHSTRRAIVEVLAEMPGLHKAELARRVGVDPSTLDHHLDLLAWVELVVEKEGVRDNEVVCFLVEDEHLWDLASTRILYGRAPVRQVALYVTANPGATSEEVGRAFGRAPGTARGHLRTLCENELVSKLVLERTHYFPTETLAEWVGTVGGGYPRSWRDEGEADRG